MTRLRRRLARALAGCASFVSPDSSPADEAARRLREYERLISADYKRMSAVSEQQYGVLAQAIADIAKRPPGGTCRL